MTVQRMSEAAARSGEAMFRRGFIDDYFSINHNQIVKEKLIQ